MTWNTGLRAKIGVTGTLVCKNKDGEVIKTIELNGSVPLADVLGVTEEKAREIVQQHQQHQQEPTT